MTGNLTLPGGGGDTDALQKQEIEELIEIEIDAIDTSVVSSGPTFPPTGEENELFFNTTDGRLYIYYNDGSSSEWVDASPESQASIVTSSPSPPANPNANDLWYDTNSGKLFIYYTDDDSSQWVEASPGGSGDGGGDGTHKADIYGTAKAFGTFTAAGTLRVTSLNVASVTLVAEGTYDVVFETPFNTDKYIIECQPMVAGTRFVGVENITTTGFRIRTFASDNSANSTGVSFTVHDNEPAEIFVGSGTVANTNIYGIAKAWARFDQTGTIRVAFNCSVVKDSRGEYTITFDTPMPNANYVITTAADDYGGSMAASPGSVTATGFRLRVANENNESANIGAYFVVHDNEPAEVAVTTFGDVINYSGPAAWGDIASGGAINASLNIANVTSKSDGYSVTFSTPMPSANYAISSSPKSGPNSSFNYAVEVTSQTTTGFEVFMRRSDGAAGPNPGFSFSVHASNALPPKGGTGADAWGYITSDTTIVSSFNIANVDRGETGRYEVTFVTPMPDTNYLAEVNIQAAANGFSYPANKTVNGFLAVINDQNGGAADLDFGIIVHATNATLPFTVTQAQIESFKSTVTALEEAVTRIQSLEATVQALQTDHTTLMNNNNEGSY
jgi:hypothetical protein